MIDIDGLNDEPIIKDQIESLKSILKDSITIEDERDIMDRIDQIKKMLNAILDLSVMNKKGCSLILEKLENVAKAPQEFGSITRNLTS